MRGLSDKLKSALEVLAGFRGPKHLHAVRFEDLTPVNRKLNQVHNSTVRLTDDTQSVVDAVGNGSEPGTLLYDVNKALEDARQAGQAAADAHQTASQVSDDLGALAADFNGTLSDAFGAVYDSIGGIQTEISLRNIEQGQIAVMADHANQAVLTALLRVSDVESGLRSAGFYLDPETGRAGIEAIDALDGRVNEVSVSVDAVNAEVALKASVAYVNQTVSEAILDPTQIPVVSDLNVRMTAAEINLDGLEAELGLKASATDVQGHEVRLGEAELAIGALEGQISLKVSQSDFDQAESRLTNAEQTLSAIDGAQSRQVLFDIRELHDAAEAAEVQTLEQLMELYRTREAAKQDVAYAIDDVRVLVRDNRVAISTATTELAAAIDGNAAQIKRETQARVSETAALATDIATYKAEFDAFDAYARQTFYAAANLDAALSTFGTELVADLEAPGGAIGTLSANLSQNYLTKVDTEQAIAGAKQELSAELSKLTGSAGGFAVTLDRLEALHLSPAAVLSNDPEFGQENTVIVTQVGPAGKTNGKTEGGAVIEIPESVAQQYGARRVKISVLARQPADYPAASFSIAYSTNDSGNSGLLSNAPAGGTGAGWEWFHFFYDVPAPNLGGADYIGIFGDDTGNAKKTEIAKVVVQIAIEAGELPEVAQLRADLNDVSGLNVDATTAHGSFLRQMNVDGGTGKVAGIDNFGTAMADIHGNAQSAYVLRAKAGGAEGELELVAWDDASGTGSAIVLTADHIFAKGVLQADKLAVGVAQNMLSNADLEMGLLHYSDSGTGTIGSNRVVSLNEPGTSYAGYDYPTVNIQANTGATKNGFARLQLAPEDKDGNSKLGYRVKKSTWYEWHTAVSATRANFRMLVRWYDATGNIISTESMLTVDDAPSSSADNPEDWDRYGKLILSPDNAAFACPMIQLYEVTSGDSGIIRVYAPFFAKTVADAKLSNYGSGNVTLVTGDGIATKAVKAEHMDVVSLAAIAASIGHFKSAESGERVEIKDGEIRVYYDNDQVAVALGYIGDMVP